MTLSKQLSVLALAAVLAAPFCAAARAADAAPATHDGARDFDFDLGVWTTHITRRLHPLSGSDASVELTGTVTVRKVWDGRAQLSDMAAGAARLA
jgi:hypothetical protein